MKKKKRNSVLWLWLKDAKPRPPGLRLWLKDAKPRPPGLRWLKLIYIKLFRIHDTPQKIALGFGLGVFLGIIPGTGPIAALFLAFLLRVNRISALLGSILTNTWLSVLTFSLSIKAGSAIMNVDWQDSYKNWIQFLKEFNISGLFKVSVLKIILPVIAGYAIVAFCAGLLAYLITVIIFTRTRQYREKSCR